MWEGIRGSSVEEVCGVPSSVTSLCDFGIVAPFVIVGSAKNCLTHACNTN